MTIDVHLRKGRRRLDKIFRRLEHIKLRKETKKKLGREKEARFFSPHSTTRYSIPYTHTCYMYTLYLRATDPRSLSTAESAAKSVGRPVGGPAWILPPSVGPRKILDVNPLSLPSTWSLLPYSLTYTCWPGTHFLRRHNNLHRRMWVPFGVCTVLTFSQVTASCEVQTRRKNRETP